MQSDIKSLLGCPLPQEYREGLKADILRTAYWPTLFVGFLVLVFEAVMILIALFNPGLLRLGQYVRVYLGLYILLLLVTLVTVGLCLAFRKWLRRHPSVFVGISIAYGFAICVWGSFLTALGQRDGGTTTVFIYVVMGVAVVVSLQPWQAGVLFGTNQIIFYFLLHLFAGSSPTWGDAVVNSLIATLLGVLIASVLYRNKAANYYNNVVIIQQNEKIRLINNQLRNMVLTDGLTGASNRRYLDEVMPDRLENARRGGETTAVLMMDIDLFKQYNDIYGHGEGDACLIRVAEIIQGSVLGEESGFVRYGGEEFVLFVMGVAPGGGRALAERVRKNVARSRIQHSGAPCGYVTISVGVCLAEASDMRSVQELVQCADEAMYSAKKEGRNRVCLYEPEDFPDDWEKAEEDEWAWEDDVR